MSVIDLRHRRTSKPSRRKERGLRFRGQVPRAIPPKNLDVCVVALVWAEMVGRLGEVDRAILEAARRTGSVRGVARELSSGRKAPRTYVQKRLGVIAQRAKRLLDQLNQAAPGGRWEDALSEEELS